MTGGGKKSSRTIVPSDGLFEWTAKASKKQRWYIKPKDGQPLFLDGPTNLPPSVDGETGSGSVIVTNESAGGAFTRRRPRLAGLGFQQ
ncbi:SOS response-associated peptidase family protein [Undibacterium sp.]|uniref:SOS response-associated peptidase family protein n=1 Tax=Undibacterium sp. TaxID=1914977 RepID=UPI0039C946BB